MSDEYKIAPSDLLETWLMVMRNGERTQHFRTRAEADRYISEPAYREYVKKRSVGTQSE